MFDALVENTKGVGVLSGTAGNTIITMTNGKDKLSSATNSPPDSIVFTWHHFH